MKRASKKPSELSESLHRRLNAYALAASAAGVGILALAQSAEAKIVHTVANIPIDANTKYHLHLNNHTGSAFTINNLYSSQGGEGASNVLNIAPKGQRAGVLGHASPLNRGAEIGPKDSFQKSAQVMLQFVYTCGDGTCGTFVRDGQWFRVNGYLGLKFFIEGKAHYGWARLNVTNLQRFRQIEATLIDYAYETIPNKPIIAGKTKGPDVITVGPGSLGRLAQGASGR